MRSTFHKKTAITTTTKSSNCFFCVYTCVLFSYVNFQYSQLAYLISSFWNMRSCYFSALTLHKQRNFKAIISYLCFKNGKIKKHAVTVVKMCIQYIQKKVLRLCPLWVIHLEIHLLDYGWNESWDFERKGESEKERDRGYEWKRKCILIESPQWGAHLIIWWNFTCLLPNKRTHSNICLFHIYSRYTMYLLCVWISRFVVAGFSVFICWFLFSLFVDDSSSLTYIELSKMIVL